MAASKPPKTFVPLAITAGVNDKIDFVVVATSYTATVASGTYFSFADLAAAVVAALTAQIPNGWTCKATSAGRVTITGDSAFYFWFATGENAAVSIRHVLGFGAVDTASALTVTGALQHQNGWYPERPCVFDSREEYDRTTSGAVAPSGAVRLLTFGSPRETRRVDFAWLPEWKTKIAREGASHPGEAVERIWRDGFAQFRYWPDATVEGAYFDAFLDPSALNSFAPGRDDRMQLYSYSLRMRACVA